MRAFLLFLIFFSATPLRPESSAAIYFVIWNVGQGQWTTLIQADSCTHFDMGGESFPWRKIQKQCANKINRVYLSHWDWDHIGALAKAPHYLHRLCLEKGPLGKASARKQNLLPFACLQNEKPDWQWIPPVQNAKASNERSQVFIKDSFLIPGDSTQKQEKIWAQGIPSTLVHYLVLGHHGSRTSTSEFLLQRLPGLRQAISSARWSRYHHPHAETILRLKAHRVPLLRTEDWGSLWFQR